MAASFIKMMAVILFLQNPVSPENRKHRSSSRFVWKKVLFLRHMMPKSKPAVVSQPSYIPHPITRFWLRIERLIHALTAQLNGNTILADGRGNRWALPKDPRPRFSVWLLESMCNISYSPGFSIVTC
jgi:hypothetical protein